MLRLAIVLRCVQVVESWTEALEDDYYQVCARPFCVPDEAPLKAQVDDTVNFWSTKTWQMQGDRVWQLCLLRYSPSGELLAIATSQNIQIYNRVWLF
jgi:hypothetical protein